MFDDYFCDRCYECWADGDDYRWDPELISIAFDFDDDKVKKVAEDRVKDEIDKIVAEAAMDLIAPKQRKYYWGDDVTMERNTDNIMNWVVKRIDALLADKKDEIMEMASTKLVDSVKRTKIWKEKYLEVLNEG